MKDCVVLTIKRILRLFIDYIIVTLNLFLPSRPGKAILPPIKSRLLLDSCVKLSSRVRSKEVTARQVVTTFIDRIRLVEPLVNSLTDTCFNDALREADRIDSLSDDDFNSECSRRPFLGVPFVGKDCVGAKGLSSTAGLVWRKGSKCLIDNPCVANLKAAGFIILGVTNVPELCMWFDSDNKLYGRTNNPHNLSHIPGGSTGGAACLTYGGCCLVVGSDIGGSIRMPSFFCGTFGHKFGPFLTDPGGQFPEVTPDRLHLWTLGPLVRSAEDLIPISRYFIGEDKFHQMKLNEGIDSWDRMRIYILSTPLGDPMASPVQSEITYAINSVGEMFSSKLKAQVTYGLPEEMMSIFSNSFDIFSHSFRSETAKTFQTGMQVDSLIVEWVRWAFGRSHHTTPALFWASMEANSPRIGDPIFLQMARDLKRMLNDLLGSDGILILPTHPISAPKHHTTIPLVPNIIYTSIFNVTGSPVTACPLGFDHQNLPIGCQVVASENQDRLTLNAAKVIEREFGGWSSPSPIDVNE